MDDAEKPIQQFIKGILRLYSRGIDMFGDQNHTGTIDIVTHKNGSVIHRQIERRGTRVYMRMSKKSLTSFLTQ